MSRRPHPWKDTMVSHNRIHQLEKVAEGRCMICPALRTDYAVYCNTCHDTRLERRRRNRERHRREDSTGGGVSGAD
jgi:hypothetical protein